MKDFYKQHKGYLKLAKILEKQSPPLDGQLIMVVGDAIQHGVKILEEKMDKVRRSLR